MTNVGSVLSLGGSGAGSPTTVNYGSEYSPPIVRVTGGTVTLHGLSAVARNDLLMGAPEPPTDGSAFLRATSANLLSLDERLPTATWVDPEQRLLEARSIQVINDLHREEPGAYEEAFPFRVVPYDFQKRVFCVARRLKNFALAPMAMGTGKTKVTLDIAAAKFLDGEIDTLCIIAPNYVQRQWVERGVPEHLSRAVSHSAAVWKPSRRGDFARMLRHTPNHLRILCFNVEAFSGETGKAYKAAIEFMHSGRCLLVVDESSRIKNPKAIRTKAILKLADHAACRGILTGTPITRGIEDMYSQYAFLDPNILGMSNYFAFRHRYCVTAPVPGRASAFGAVRIVGYKNVEEFIHKIAPVTFAIPKDVLGLPAKVYEQYDVTMTPEQERIYNAMRDELIEDLVTQHIANPANAAVRLTRLQQVLSGRYFEYPVSSDPDEVPDTIPRDVASNRISCLIDLLNDYDGQAVIWARFRDDIVAIQKALENIGYPAVSYYGETKDADRVAAVQKFRDGEVRYFVANPATAGTGVDGLQVAGLAVYFNNSFNAEQRWQSEDRIHRIGMTGTALIVDMVVPGTVDELVLDNLKSKSDLARAVTEAPEILRGRRRDET